MQRIICKHGKLSERAAFLFMCSLPQGFAVFYLRLFFVFLSTSRLLAGMSYVEKKQGGGNPQEYTVSDLFCIAAAKAGAEHH